MWCSDQNVLWSLTCPKSTSSIPADRIFRLHNQTWDSGTLPLLLFTFPHLSSLSFEISLRLAMIMIVMIGWDWWRGQTGVLFQHLKNQISPLAGQYFVRKQNWNIYFYFWHFCGISIYCNLNKRLIWITLEIWHRYYL